MSSNKKKGRLALKKKPAPLAATSEAKGSTQTTILSMFKKQRGKDEPSTTTVSDKESGSEGDVIITGITQEKTEHVPEREIDVNSKTDKRIESTESTKSKKKGRLSLAKKDSSVENSSCISAEKKSVKQDLAKTDKKESKVNDPCNAINEVSGDVPSGNRKRKSLDSDRPKPYKLRKHRTAPIIEIASESDSGDDNNDERKSGLQLVSDVNNDIPSSGGSDFQDNTRKRKHKASLKRSKTADDVLLVTPEKRDTRKKSSLCKDKQKNIHAETEDVDNSSEDKKHKQQQPETVDPGLSHTKNNKQKHSATHPKDKHAVPDLKRKTSTSENKKKSVSSSPRDKDDKEKTKQKQVGKKKTRAMNSDQSVTDVIDVDSEKSEPKEFKQQTLQQLFKKKSLDADTTKEAKLKLSDNVNKGKGDIKDSTGKVSGSLKTKHKAKAGTKDKKGEVKDKLELEGDDDDNEDDEEKGEEEVVYKVPYYLENFRTILESVLADKENARLFDDTDMAHVNAFNKLTEPSQKLYVRLFSRKLAWLPMSRLKYPEISSDVPSLVDELHDAGLIHMGDKLDDLGIVLKILAAPDLKTLAKTFHINNTGTKDKIIELLLKKSQQSSIATMFTGGAGHSTQKTMLSRALSYLGKVCRLEETVRAVFIRLLMLFSLYHTNFDEESAGGGQNQLFQMLMANIGRVVYPTYTIDRQTPVFQDRTALVRFETALQFELDLQVQIEKSRWDRAYELYSQAKAVGASLNKDKKIRKWDAALPEFLRLYTACSVYARIDSLGVEILQRQKRYREAVALLQELIDQGLYIVHHRGHWYERLALNLDAHLKSQQKSLDVVKQGLSDPRVHTGRRLALYERAKKICEAPKSKFADQLADIDHDPMTPTPEVTIEGMVISDATSMGMKYQFIMSGDTDQTTLCAVEELVLEHYKTHGYPEGLHAEGSIVSNLFVLFFWDTLFMPVPDVFHGPFQTCPLDLHTQDFYKNRKPTLDERLEWIQQAEEEELLAVVGETWEKHSGEMCQGISWERFAGPETHQGLVKCMGGKVIAGMLERFVKNPRHTRSGFPDLTLWNTETKALKICEVKGPNDRLSYKQILWIDYLLKLGVDAEACYVKAVGSKRLKPQSSMS